jgi:phosphohistidine phosphatase
MKTLFLIRHSKAVTRKANIPDFQRTLVKAGEKKCMSMAKKLKREGVTPDLMISSTANRALETAHLFAQNLNYPTHEIMVKDALYNEMSPEALLYVIRQVDDRYNSIMLFGHNPAFTDFASHLVRGFDQDIPKTGIVGIQFQKESWKTVAKGSGKLAFFEYPKRVAKTMKRLEGELRDELTQKAQEILDRIDTKSAKKLRKQLAKSSDKIAKDFVKVLKAATIKEEKKAFAAEKAKAAKSKAPVKPKARAKPKSPAKLKPPVKPKTAVKPQAPAKPKAKKPEAKPAVKVSAKPAPKIIKPAAQAVPRATKPKTKVAAKPTTKAASKKPAPRQATRPKPMPTKKTAAPRKPATTKTK